MIPRIGISDSAPEGIAIERNGPNRVSVITWRTVHGMRIRTAEHFTRQEVAHFIGATIPPRLRKRPRGRVEGEIPT